MSTIFTTVTARADQEETLQAVVVRWPQFSAPELRRLRFLAYRRDTGRLRPPAPVGPEVEGLCAEIAASLRTPPPRLQHAAAGGVLPLCRCRYCTP